MTQQTTELKHLVKQFCHDVRTPLSTLKNEIELLAMNGREEDFQPLKQSLEVVVKKLNEFQLKVDNNVV